jgi:phage gp36-like protein
MAYCSLADILEEIDEEVLIAITDTTDSGVVDSVKIDSAIARADSIIDGYLSSRVSVPVVTVTQTLKTLSIDIAIHRLFSRKESVPQEREKKFEQALEFLNAFTKGLVELGAPISGESLGYSAAAIYYAPEKDFDEEFIGGY